MRDVDQGCLDDLCQDLVERTRDFCPDLVIGIATGGEVVARAMLPFFDDEPAILAIRLQRPGTQVKRLVRADLLLGRLPRRVVDVMRWFEVEYRELAFRVTRRATAPSIRSPRDQVVLDLLAPAQDARRILVVDDTVDSGRTLGLAVDLVRSVSPDAVVRTAVLTSTWRRPPLVPDYLLFARTLLRLPWSFDAAAR